MDGLQGIPPGRTSNEEEVLRGIQQGSGMAREGKLQAETRLAEQGKGRPGGSSVGRRNRSDRKLHAAACCGKAGAGTDDE